MINFNKTKIDKDNVIEPKVFGEKKGDKYAIK